jgi:hypothetical protein
MVLRKAIFAAGTALVLAAPVANAAPVSTHVGALTASGSNSIVDVQYRRGGGRNWRYGARIGAGIAAGAIIYNYAYRPRPGSYYDTYDYVGPYYYPSGYRGDPRVICARNFKSFEWRTGLYTTYGGEKKLCPYLRDY